MSKMSNLDLVLDEMITAGQKMIEAATALRDMFAFAFGFGYNIPIFHY